MSMENSERSDRNTTRRPSGLSDGARFSSPPLPSREISDVANACGFCVVSMNGAYAAYVAACQSR